MSTQPGPAAYCNRRLAPRHRAATSWVALALGGLIAIGLVRGARAAAPIDAEQLAANGVRRVEGQRLTLFTDLPARPEIDALPLVFDQAWPGWCAYFSTPDPPADVRLTGYLMSDAERFTRLGLLPVDLPRFLHGFTRGQEFWVREQPSDYYRRHLVLHEGTHAFMFGTLGGCGPAWYMEGTAELLATHRLTAQGCDLGWFPSRRDDVPYWGRIALIEDAIAAGRWRSLPQVLALTPEAYLEADAYAWSWAAAAFLDGHPRYRDLFRKLPRQVTRQSLLPDAPTSYGQLWPMARAEWGLFTRELVFGHDLPRTALDFSPGGTSENWPRQVRVLADRGWQPAGCQLLAGQNYRIRARGRFQIAQTDRPWPCEAGGITIRYWHGSPLGQLQAVVAAPPTELTSLATPDGPELWAEAFHTHTAVGLENTLRAARNGTLYLRLNDSPGELADNQGAVDVEIAPAPE